MGTIITDDNFRNLVRAYLNRQQLPEDLQGVRIGNWDVSRVTNMSRAFFNSDFNESLARWDVSRVTDFSQMFDGAGFFNQSLDTWNIGGNVDVNVNGFINMECMFQEASNFNRPLDTWDVSKVNDMTGMFCNATNFNQNLNMWDVSNVTSMAGMFMLTNNFNGDISAWDVSRVTNMRNMFARAEAFNRNIDYWDVSNVTDMECIFEDSGIEQRLDHWRINQQVRDEARRIGSRYYGFGGDYSNMYDINKKLFTRRNVLPPLRRPVRPPLRQRPNLPPPDRDPPPQRNVRNYGYNDDVQLNREIHSTFNRFDVNKFVETVEGLNEKNNYRLNDSANIFQPLFDYIQQNYGEDKGTQTKELNVIYSRNIEPYINNSYNKTPKINGVRIIIAYVVNQPSEFVTNYINTYIFDCNNAYSRLSNSTEESLRSCSKGMYERLFTTIKDVIVTFCSDKILSGGKKRKAENVSVEVNEPNKEPKIMCKEEWIELFHLFPSDFTVGELFKQWNEMYLTSGPDGGPTEEIQNMTKEERENTFRNFVKSKLPHIDENSLEAEITRNNYVFENLSFGGRKKRKNVGTKKRKYAGTKKRKYSGTKKRKYSGTRKRNNNRKNKSKEEEKRTERIMKK